jgi:hypothetical protein
VFRELREDKVPKEQLVLKGDKVLKELKVLKVI